MRTEHVPYELMDYATNRLNAKEHKRVELHLQNCTECTAHFLELQAAAQLLNHGRRNAPPPAYYATILPRVRERLASQPRTFRGYRDRVMRIVLPLAASVFLLVLVIRISSNSFSVQPQTEALHQAVLDLNEEEIIQAAEKDYAGISLFPVQEAAAAGVAEHLQGDRFLKSAISRQIESDEAAEMDLEGMVSDLNGDQVDQVLSDLSERNVL